MKNITYVDENDTVIGSGSRAEAIAKSIAHRIARVFVFNAAGQLLIQKRSEKVASAGKWDQSAAGHVDEGEDYHTAALREAKEEINLRDTELHEIGKFYTEEVDNGITRKRFNVLFRADYNGELQPDNDEVSEIKWIHPEELASWMDTRPNDFTRGFIQSYQFYKKYLGEA